MKKIISTLSLGFVLLTLVSCGDNSATPQASEQQTMHVEDIVASETIIESESTTEEDIASEVAPEPEHPAPPIEIINQIDPNNPGHFWFEVNGIRYYLGDPVSSLGDQFNLTSGRLDETLAPNSVTVGGPINISHSTEDARIHINVANTTDDDILVRDGVIASVNISSSDTGSRTSRIDLRLINGFYMAPIAGTCIDELLEILGEPDFEYDPGFRTFNRIYGTYSIVGGATLLGVGYRFSENLNVNELSAVTISIVDRLID